MNDVAMNDKAAIEQLIADRVEAMKTGDAQAIVDTMAPSPVVYSLAPPLRQPEENGTRAVAALQAWFDEKGGRVGSAVRDVEITAGGDVAFCHFLESMGSPDDTQGEKFTMWFRTTLGLRRVGGRWLIAHEHTSTPFYMDGSMRAAADLQP